MISKSAGVAACALGLASAAVLGPVTGASAATGSTVRHCVANVDTGTVQCGTDRQKLLADAARVTASTLVIAVFYDGTGYTGATQTFVKGSQCTSSYDNEVQWDDLSQLGWNNRVSSVKTYNHCDVKLYDGFSFTGSASVWIDASSNLGQIGAGWNNRASSVKFS